MSELEPHDDYNASDQAEKIARKYYDDTSREGILNGIRKMRENRDFLEQNLTLLRVLYPNHWLQYQTRKLFQIAITKTFGKN